MMIPKELMKQYKLPSFEDWNEAVELGVYPNDLELYYMFLSRTDHIPNKIVEDLLENLADATLVTFASVVFNFLADVRIKYKDVLQYRKLARQKINELEAIE